MGRLFAEALVLDVPLPVYSPLISEMPDNVKDRILSFVNNSDSDTSCRSDDLVGVDAELPIDDFGPNYPGDASDQPVGKHFLDILLLHNTYAYMMPDTPDSPRAGTSSAGDRVGECDFHSCEEFLSLDSDSNTSDFC